MPIIRELSKFITCPICLPNNECWYYFGAYSIREQDGQEIFELWVEKAKYKFRGDDFCNSWTDGELYQKKDIPLNKAKLKVILDEDCEYKIAVSVEDNQWITLPKSSLFGENLNLKKYYNQELSLSRGENFSSFSNGKYYIPKVTYGQIKICELAPFSFPNCDRGKAELEGSSSPWVNVKNNKIVVEKNGEGELLIYFADGDGIRLANINGGIKNIVDYVNSTLKAVLLENSNIREVLPELELELDVIIPLERKVKCLVNKMYSEVAERVAHLEAKNNEDQEILVNSPILQEGVATKLRENPGNAKGPKGDKGDPGKDGAPGSKGDKGDPGKDGAPGSKGDKGELGPKGDKGDPGKDGAPGSKGDKGDPGKDGAPGSKGDKGELGPKGDPGKDGAPGSKGDKGDPGPKGDKGDPGKDGAPGSKGDKGDPGKNGAPGSKGDKGDPGPKGGKGDPGKDGAPGSKGDKGELGPKGDPGKDGAPGSKGDKGDPGPKGDKGDPGKDGAPGSKGDKGDPGPKGDKGDPGKDGEQGPQGDPGQDGESPSANAVAAQLLTGANKNTLITEVASDEGLQEAIAGNHVLKDAVTTALNGDNDFHNIVKRATIDSSTNANTKFHW